MKNGVKILLAATAFCVAIYIGVFIGRNFGGLTLHLSGSGQSYISLDSRPKKAILVNINTATVDELTQVPGISFRIAEKIIAYRKEYGAFLSLEELLQIPGIGETLLEKMWPYITIAE